jgi:hypothetical protein
MRVRQNTAKTRARFTGKQELAERVVIVERNRNTLGKRSDKDAVVLIRSPLGVIGSRILSLVMEARGRLEIRWGAKRPGSSLVDRF